MKPSKDLDEQIDEIRQAVESIFKSPHCESCHEDWDYDYSYKTDSCCTRFMSDSIDKVVALIEQIEREAKVEAFGEIVSEWGLDVKSQWFSSSGGAVDLASMAEHRIEELQKGAI